METEEKWVYRDGSLEEKVTTKTDSEGNVEEIHQKAYTDIFDERHATDVTSRIRYTE